jgi:hypothetical protein
MDQASLFLPTNYSNFNPSGSKHPVYQEIAIPGLARRTGGNRPQMLDIEALCYMLKAQEGLFGLLDGDLL